jgi:multidrug resistance efflux pump
MTWPNRLRLWTGLILVLALVAALTLLVNQRSRQAFTDNAEVGARQSTIGSEYGGVVVAQYVQAGQVVHTGEKLFTLSSLDLQRDVANGLKPVSTSSYTIDAQHGQVTYVAQMDGTLTDIQAKQGTFVAAGDMATITAGGTQYVTAQFRLTPDQYGRVRVGGTADVQLPNRARLPASVSHVSVQTSQGVAVTTVSLAVPKLRTRSLTSLSQPGSPVSVTLTLADTGILSGPTNKFRDFLQRIGVR